MIHDTKPQHHCNKRRGGGCTMFVCVWTRQDTEQTSREKQRVIDDRHLICSRLTWKTQKAMFSGSRMWTSQPDLPIPKMMIIIVMITFNSCSLTWPVSCFVNRIIFMLSLSWLWHRLISFWYTSVGMLCTATIQICDTYATMEAEPHSVMSSKSWMARSGQQWIMTRKSRSQRLR